MQAIPAIKLRIAEHPQLGYGCSSKPTLCGKFTSHAAV